ncbi:hypothetical protein ABZ491_22895 [Micromonospora rifamycinica]|uniref:hypothetical protein n=1 Tax=Micromonospora rifamycinica TaxID=291594 RepID=UPI0033CE54BD
MLTTDCSNIDRSKVAPAIEQALASDNRVVEIAPITNRPEWVGRETMYPSAVNSTRDALLAGMHFHAINFSDPITFRVSVPARNQPSFRGYHDIPSDDYWVAWDGWTAFVLWPQPASAKIPRAGGQIVVSVLEDAAKQAGFELYVQACSPGCKNLFAHPDLRIKESPSSGTFVVRDDNPTDFIVDLEVFTGSHDPLSLAHRIGEWFHYEMRTFAQYKNSSRHIRDIERIARNMVDELLELNLHKITRSQLPARKRIRGLREHRQQSREALRLIALLWFAFARIEAIKRDWLEARRALEDAISNHNIEPIFSTDRADDDAAVASLELSFIKAAVEQSATRMDSRLVANVTAIGAVFALVGALLGALATAIFS